MKTVEILMKNLAQLIEHGRLTKGRFIDNETMVCFTELLNDATVTYHQLQYEMMPLEYQKAFKGLSVGDRVLRFKIVGIWDGWNAEDRYTPRPKNRVDQ